MNSITYFVVLQMCILTILNFVAPSSPVLGRIGLIYWILLWATLIGFTVVALFRSARIIYRHRMGLTAIIVIVYIGLILFSAWDPRFLSDESTREIGCALHYLRSDPGLLFTQTCHLGYPARQFFIPALPSLLFGTHLSTLQLGNTIYFVVGYIVFLYGLLITQQKRPFADITTALVLSCLPHFYIANSLIFLYEQAMYPLGFSLSIAGLWLIWFHNKSYISLLLIGLMQLVLITSYTPSLSLVCANVVLFFILSIQLKKQRIPIWPIPLLFILVTAASIAVSFSTRTDMRIVEQTTKDSIFTTRALQTITGVWQHITVDPGSNAWTSPIFTFPFFSLLLLGLTNTFGPIYVGVSMWISAVIFIAVFSHGYADGSVDYKLQRATIVIPFMLLLVRKGLQHIHISKYALMFLCILLVVTAGGELYLIRSRRSDTKQVVIANQLQSNIGTMTPNTLIFESSISEYAKIDNFSDAAQYFLPDWHSEMINQDNITSCQYPRGILLIPTTNICYIALQTHHADRTYTILHTFRLTSPEVKPPNIDIAVFDAR